jgi:hypothetical protein
MHWCFVVSMQKRKRSRNLIKGGVIDAAKVLRESPLLAFSHAKGILTTGAWDTGFGLSTDQEALR